ncbi:hypothetical protein P171DRAFT_426581 [Karstenula rhodostoma CBS 690.94]|uniref:Ribonuclease H1 N-terminal domain-containing protein n=1 Tax=Karstenula rhodostoma CBS 690.94 TaxID=1392251 RepID=A0A9P4UIY0_9PLEO|nr:hypothetical protein P171DRAFT_426581 [Karstenula rhodostoma CBS 690.94]
MSPTTYYVVRNCARPKIFNDELQMQSYRRMYPASCYAHFHDIAKAQYWLETGAAEEGKQRKLYAVAKARKGKTSGIYTSWADAQPHVQGPNGFVRGTKCKGCDTREQADDFCLRNNKEGWRSKHDIPFFENSFDGFKDYVPPQVPDFDTQFKSLEDANPQWDEDEKRRQRSAALSKALVTAFAFTTPPNPTSATSEIPTTPPPKPDADFASFTDVQKLAFYQSLCRFTSHPLADSIDACIHTLKTEAPFVNIFDVIDASRQNRALRSSELFSDWATFKAANDRPGRRIDRAFAKNDPVLAPFLQDFAMGPGSHVVRGSRRGHGERWAPYGRSEEAARAPRG